MSSGNVKYLKYIAKHQEKITICIWFSLITLRISTDALWQLSSAQWQHYVHVKSRLRESESLQGD